MTKKKPNIVLLMADQFRNDHTSWSPSSRMATPNLDRIAEGTTFQHCVTSNPVCTPARSSLLTGRYSRQIHMLNMSGDLSQDIPTYPQALQKAGYTTAGIGKFHWLQTWPWGTPRGEGLDLVALKPRLKKYGFDEVWECCGKQLAVQNYCDYAKHLDQKKKLEEYRDHVESEGKNTNHAAQVGFTGNPWPLDEEDYPDTVTADVMVDWLGKQGNNPEPFFLLGSFVSPHQPLDPPQSYLDQIPYEEIDDFVMGEGEENLDLVTKKRMWTLRRSYKAMVKLVDDQIGRVLDQLEKMNILDNTIVLFVADHGEMLGDHGRFQKSIHWHPSAVVPCAIRHPDYVHRSSVKSPVELTDLTASILEWAGLDPHQSISKSWPRFQDMLPGRSLHPLVSGEQERVRDYAFCEYTNEWSMIRSDRFAYVRHHYGEPDDKTEQLYDLQEDPDECHNLANDPDYSQELVWHRNRYIHILETYPPAQTSWAPFGNK